MLPNFTTVKLVCLVVPAMELSARVLWVDGAGGNMLPAVL